MTYISGKARLTRLPPQASAPLLIAIFALLILAPCAHARIVIDSFGSSGSFGGQFSISRGIAVNQTGAGGVAAGTVYVADGGNRRIQRLTPAGDFQRTWGFNVTGRDERHLIGITGISNGCGTGHCAGTFKLTFDGSTTGDIRAESNTGVDRRGAIQSALGGLPSIGVGNVIVSGGIDGPYTVKFVGALGGTDVPQIIADGSELIGPSPSISVATLEDGSGGSFAGFEICTVANQCQDGSGADTAANGGQLNAPAGLAVDQSSGDVYVAEEGNRRISKFDADGNFLRAFGWDVVSTGGSGDVSTDAFEICTVAADCKSAAEPGADGGRFGADAGNPILDSSGDLWVPDPSNRRIQRFEADGAFVAAYGWDVDTTGGSGSLEGCASTAPGDCQAGLAGSTPGQFALKQGKLNTPSPQFIAFDSAGDLYALDPGNSRVQKFDSALASASAFLLDGGPLVISPSSVMAAAEGGDRIALTGVNAAGNNLAGVFEYDLGGALVETSIPNTGFHPFGVTGMGFDSTSGRLYTTLNANLLEWVLALGDAPTPTAASDPPTDLTDHSAALNATVDPMDASVECTFQYSEDEVAWVDVPEAECDSLDPEGGPQTVSEEVDGLEPGGHYFVRLVVSRRFDDSTAVTSSQQEFTALSLPPVLSLVGSAKLTDTSAYLVGRVLPRSQLTHHRFHYTPAGGDFVDCGEVANPNCLATPEADLVGSAEAVAAIQITGLEPDAEYEFKLIADNVAGSTESSTLSFHTAAEPLPEPTERAYEMVSPPEKNGGGAIVGYRYSSVAYDGEGIGFCTDAQFGDPPANLGNLCAHYASQRYVEGWRTQAIQPGFCFPTGKSHVQTVSLNVDAAFLDRPESADCMVEPLVDPAPMPGGYAYREDLTTDPLSYHLLNPQPGYTANSSSGSNGGGYQAASDEFDHIVYASPDQQTGDAPAGSFQKLYEWAGGTLRLVSKDTSNAPFATSSSVPGGSTSDSYNAISSSGLRIFFQNGSGSAQELYMRQQGTTTYWISQQECSPACSDTAAADNFQLATPDGAKALFTSTAKLNNDDSNATGADLYLYTHSGNPAANTNLTLLSKDSEAADGTGASVQGVLGMSDSGDVVYFAANGQLVPGQPTAAGPKLYRWDRSGGSPTLSYLATLNSGESAGNWAAAAGQVVNRALTPDGSRLLIQTTVALDPFADTDPDRDLYLLDDEDAGWRCVSCQAPGAPSAGDTIMTPGAGGQLVNAVGQERRIVISDDGARVFFATRDPLDPAEDTNGRADVYEWHEGAVQLVSSGKDPAGALLLGAGHDGRDVLFLTDSQLVGWDTDRANDIYDARIGGGFAEPTPFEAPCEGEACRDGGSTAPDDLGAGTPQFKGSGNPDPGFDTGADRCARLGKIVRKQLVLAKRARVRARRLSRAAKRSGSPRQAQAMRRKARRFALGARKRGRSAKQNANRAKRCRRTSRSRRSR